MVHACCSRHRQDRAASVARATAGVRAAVARDATRTHASRPAKAPTIAHTWSIGALTVPVVMKVQGGPRASTGCLDATSAGGCGFPVRGAPLLCWLPFIELLRRFS